MKEAVKVGSKRYRFKESAIEKGKEELGTIALHKDRRNGLEQNEDRTGRESDCEGRKQAIKVKGKRHG